MSRLYRDDNGLLPAYAWPGGYPMFYLVADNGILCPECANVEGSEDTDDSQWKLVAADIHWEGPVILCDHCGQEIESAYGDPDCEDTDD